MEIWRSVTLRYTHCANTFVLLLCVAASLTSISTVEAGEPAKPATLIALNSLGYMPSAPKRATVTGQGTTFEVRDLASLEVILKGNVESVAKPIKNDTATKVVDFSSVQRKGRYLLVVAGIGESAEFDITEDLFNWPFYCVMKGMYLSRCGCMVHARIGDANYQHPACHINDALLDFAGGHTGERQDGVGGWHDAGDYNKYAVNGAFTVGMMLQTWEHFGDRLKSLKLDLPESSNTTPDFMDEVRWEVEWLLKMQAPDGKAYHKLSTRNFGRFEMPEAEVTPRYFSPWGTAVTADITAATAQSARVFRPIDAVFADRCLAAAKKGYAILLAHPVPEVPDQSMFSTWQYDSPDLDDRSWAAAELWETTGDDTYRQDYESSVQKMRQLRHGSPNDIVDSEWDWNNVRNLGTFTYVLSKRPGRDPELMGHLKQAVIQSSDTMLDVAQQHPYGRTLGEKYYWGCNGTVVRQAMNLHMACLLTGDAKYDVAIQQSLDYVLGRNPYGRSFVTGLGYHPPQYPHDRRSGQSKEGKPWPGYLVGGPWPTARDWHDDRDDFRTNEIAINWNGALIYALAGFVRAADFRQSVAVAQKELSLTTQGK